GGPLRPPDRPRGAAPARLRPRGQAGGGGDGAPGAGDPGRAGLLRPVPGRIGRGHAPTPGDAVPRNVGGVAPAYRHGLFRARLRPWPTTGACVTAMPEDDSRSSSQEPPEKRRSWLDRISSAISGEPTTREDLVEILRDAQAGGLIQADTLRTMEGAMAVSEL